MDSNKFNKGLNTFQLTMLAVGTVIGSGVFVLTGIGIKYVGNLAPIVYVLAALVVILNSVPTIISGTTLPTTGGFYKYISRLLSPTVGFFYMWTRIIGIFSLSVVLLAFGQYLQIIFPNVNTTIASLAVLVILTVFNMLKINILGNINKYMVLILMFSFGLFVALGVPHVDLSRIETFNKVTFDNLLLAIIFYMYALDGAAVVVNMGGECKTPRKSIPFAIAFGVVLAATVYALVTFIAVTAVDYTVLGGAPLGEYAKAFMSPTMFFFFILGGALLAIISTINGGLLINPRILWAGANDEIFPKWFAKLSSNGIPARTLVATAVVAAIPIITNIDISNIVALVAVPSSIMMISYNFSILQIPKKFPNSYNESFKKLPYPVLVLLIVLASVISFRLSLSAYKKLDASILTGIAIFYGVGTVYFFYLKNAWKKKGKSFADIKGSYDESWVVEEERLGNKGGKTDVA